MSASNQRAQQRTRIDLARGDSFLPRWVQDGVRALLNPVVRFALAAHITPNTITVAGLGIVCVAAWLIAQGALVAAGLVVIGGSLLDAVDGALARASGGPTRFGGFLDSTVDRAAEAALFIGIALHFVARSDDPLMPLLAALAALIGSFMVSYTRARAEALGYAASIGIAPRPERITLLAAGLLLAGLGFGAGLVAALWVIAVLTAATVLQRIWHVWRQSIAAGVPANRRPGGQLNAKENDQRG